MKFLNLSTLLTFFIAFTLISCDEDNCIKGEGPIETRTIELASFNKVSLLGIDHVTIKQGETQEINISGHPNIIDELNTNISDQHWEIRLRDGCYNNADLDIEITIPNLKAASLVGSGKIMVEDFSDQENQSFVLSGSGDIDISGNTGTRELTFSITGSGNIHCSKSFSDLESVNLNISGSGDYEGFPLQSDNYEVILSGSGNANLYAENKLNGNITGSGNINYKGSPEINVTVTGSGRVINSN